MIIAAAILIFIGVLNYELHVDLKAWRTQIDVQHNAKPLRRFPMLLPSMVGLTIESPVTWYWCFPLITLPLACFTWWLLFDGLYNIQRNHPWWFNGDAVGKADDSFLDRILRKMSDRQERWLKIGGVLVFTFLYILSLTLFQFNI